MSIYSHSWFNVYVEPEIVTLIHFSEGKRENEYSDVPIGRHGGLHEFEPDNSGWPFPSSAIFHLWNVSARMYDDLYMDLHQDSHRIVLCGADVQIIHIPLGMYLSTLLRIDRTDTLTLISLHQSEPNEPVPSVKYISFDGNALWNVSC